MAFLALEHFSNGCLQMSLMCTDTAARGRSIAVHRSGWGPQCAIICWSVERAVAGIARFRRFLVSFRVDVTARAHATDVAPCGDAVVIRAVTCFASIHVPLVCHDLSPVKRRRRTLTPAARVRVKAMAGVATYATGAPLKIL